MLGNGTKNATARGLSGNTLWLLDQTSRSVNPISANINSLVMKQSWLKNGLYNTAAGIIRIGLGLLTLPVLIRLLGTEDYGLWTLAITVISIVTLAESGLSLSTTMFVSQDLQRKDIRALSQTLTITVGAMLILSALAGLCLWVFAAPIVSTFTKLQPSQQAVTVEALKLGAVVVWARLLQQVVVGIEQAYQRYDLSNLVNTLQTLTLNVGFLVVVLSGGKVVALMKWQLCTAIIALVAHSWLSLFLLRGLKVRIAWDRQRGLEIFHYSLMSWLISLGGAMFSQVDKLIVGATLGTSALGIYGAITNITNQINVFSALPIQPMMPALSALVVKDDFDAIEVEQRIGQTFMVNSLFSLGIGSILLTIAPFFLRLLLGSVQSSDIVLAFRVVVLVYSLYSLNAVGFYLCLGLNAAQACMTIQIVGGVVALASICLGASQFGLLGAMLGNLGFIITWLMNVHGLKLLKISGFKWLQWLAVPLLLTGSIFLVGTIGRDDSILKLVVMVALTIGLFSWYIFHQRATLKLVYGKLHRTG